MTYNISWSGTANTLGDIFVGVNTNSGGLMGIMILFALWVIVFLSFSGTDTKKVLLADGFFVTVIGIFMWAAGLFSLVYLTVPIVLLIVGIFAYMLS